MSDQASAATTPSRLAGLLPPAVALAYPFLLVALFHAAHLGGAAGVAAATGAMALVFAAPLVAFAAARRFGGSANPSIATARARLAAHLACCAPPLFTFIGVVTYMAGVAGWELWIWAVLWFGIAAWTRAGNGQPVAASAVPRRLGAIHGSVALTVILGFLLLHFANHIVGLWSAEAHIAFMDAVRKWYRSKLVEPLLVAFMLFMAGSGLVLLRARLSRPATGFFDTLQTATGAYLLFFIPGHMNSVFLYQRWFAGKDTDFWFASGGEAGLLGDPWSVRLLPHYFLGVWSVATHAACGLRHVMLAHGTRESTANAITVAISAAGALGAGAMVLALCRVHLAA